MKIHSFSFSFPAPLRRLLLLLSFESAVHGGVLNRHLSEDEVTMCSFGKRRAKSRRERKTFFSKIDSICRIDENDSFFYSKQKHSPVPQHLAQHALVQLQEHARLRDASDDEVAALGVRREQGHCSFFVVVVSFVVVVETENEQEKTTTTM